MKVLFGWNVSTLAGIATDAQAMQPEAALTITQPGLSSGQQLWFDAQAVLII